MLAGTRSEIFEGRPQHFRNRPGLRNTSACPMRSVSVEDLRKLSDAFVPEIAAQFRKPFPGLFPRLGRMPVNLDIRLQEGPHEPWPDGALVIGAVAAARVALVAA